MEKLNFFTVAHDYVKLLQEAEIAKRGFSRVPNMEYAGRKPKFLCGIVLQINGTKYYVPVTSYKEQKPDNFLIKAANGQVVSSLRFNYMFPVPKELLAEREISSEPDKAYRALLSQELRYCIDNQDTIRKLAKRTYKRVLLGKDVGLVKNSCDFLLLEKMCLEYRKQKGYVPAEKNLNSKMSDAKKRVTDSYLESQYATLEACDLVLQNKAGFSDQQIARAEQIKAATLKNIEKRTKILKDGH